MNPIGLLLIITEKKIKELISSKLDNINGLGTKLIISLIKYFGGIDKIYEASLDDLKSVPGIGEKKAVKIHSQLINMNLPNFYRFQDCCS